MPFQAWLWTDMNWWYAYKLGQAGMVPDIETRALYMIARNSITELHFLVFSTILSWVRTLLSWQGDLELVILLPHLLRELGLQECSTTSGYAVNLTLIVSSIISSSHFAVQCPLGTGQASKMAKWTNRADVWFASVVTTVPRPISYAHSTWLWWYSG